MSFYDDASLVFIAGGAAGKAGKIYNLKPVEELIGSNLLSNGTFDDGSDWSFTNAGGTHGWSISGGTAICDDSAATANRNLVSTLSLTSGKSYRLRLDILQSADNMSVIIGSTTLSTTLPTGTNIGYNYDIPASAHSGGILSIYAGTSDLQEVDNISVKEMPSAPADFTLNRGANIVATRVGKDGYIEKGRENLLLQSNQFDDTDTWKNGTLTGGQSGYDGSSDAWEFVAASAGNNFYQTVSPSGVNTVSFYVKGDGSTGARIYLYGPATSAFFRLSGSGEVYSSSTQAIDASITPVSVASGWYRISLTFYDDGTSSGDYQNVTRVYVYTTNNSGSNAAGTIYVQDAQLEQGLVATDYIETGTTTATASLLEDEPRFDYTGGGCPALLLEPARTNLMGHSEYFGAWTGTNTTVNDNQADSPEGVSNAAEIVPTAVSGEHYIQYGSFSRTAGEYLTQSVYAKSNGYNYIYLNNAASRLWAVFDIVNGEVEYLGSNGTDFTNESADIQSVGNGWFRCTLTGEAVTSASSYIRVGCSPDSVNSYSVSFLGNGTSGAFMYGMQVEAGGNATSYMPNYGAAATVTRSADSITQITAPDVNTDAYTFFADDSHDLETDSNRGPRMSGSSNDALMGYYTNGDKYFFCFTNDGSGTKAFNNYNAGALTEAKYAFVIDNTSNTAKLFLNGSFVASGTTSVAVEADAINFGAGAGSPNRTSQVIYFPTALSNNDAEILTGATSYRSFNVMRSALNYTIYE